MIHPPAWFGDACLILTSLLTQGIPFLLLGALVGGVVAAWVPMSLVLRGWPKHSLVSVLCGAAFALLLPACDCAVVPIVRRLVRKGVPMSAGVAYMVAAPTLNPICLVSTYFAFRVGSPWHMLALRAGGSFFLAVVVGLIASRFSPQFLLRAKVLLSSATESEPAPWMEIKEGTGMRWRQGATALAVGTTDFLDVTTLYVLGAMCSAVLQTFLPLGKMLAAHGALGVPMAMGLAFLLSLCSFADAFVVNAFAALGLAGQMAFLWLGPIYNLRVLFLYRNIFRYRAIAGLGLVIVVVIGGMTLVIRELGWS
jgi:uncharacterized membrane protein YraQ (UPF0718 family)